jgi:hypothetical protein
MIFLNYRHAFDKLGSGLAELLFNILWEPRARLRRQTVRALTLHLLTFESRIQNDDVANLTDAISRQHELQVECQFCFGLSAV